MAGESIVINCVCGICGLTFVLTLLSEAVIPIDGVECPNCGHKTNDCLRKGGA